MRLIFITQVIMRTEVSMDMKTVADLLMEAITLTNKRAYESESEGHDVFQSAELIKGLLLFITPRCTSTEDLKDFFLALEDDRFGTRPVLVKLMEENLQLILFLFDLAWTKVAQSDKPDWPGCIQFLQDCIHRCRDWSASLMVAVASRCIAVIQNEYLHDRQGALNTLNQATGQLPQPQYLITHVRAGILFDMKEYDESLKLWSILREWPDCPPTVAFEVSRCGQMAAAAISDWKTVALVARYGEEMAFKANIPIHAIAFRADEAFALWKEGAFEDSVATFASVLDSFWCLPDFTTDLQSYYIQRSVGHAIGWVHRQIRGGKENWEEPPVAVFSKLRMDEEIKDQPMHSALGLWWMLADVEFDKCRGKTFYARSVKECGQHTQPDVEMMVAELGIRISLNEADSKTVLTKICDCIEKMDSNRNAILARTALTPELRGMFESEARAGIDAHASSVSGVLTAAIVGHVNRYGLEDLPVQNWKAECLRRGFTEERLLGWFALLEQVPHSTTTSMMAVLSDVNRDNYQRLVAAIVILNDEGSEPQMLMYASLILFLHATSDMWCKTVERDRRSGCKGMGRPRQEQQV